MAGATVLRVLSGRLKGAEHRLHGGKFVRVGHGFDHDIVLRDPSTRGLSLELHLGDEVATVRVVAGEAQLFGRPVGAGEEAALPAFIPMMLGGFAVAVGEPTSERWEETERLSSMLTVAETGGQRAALGERVATRFYPMRDALSLERRWPIYTALAAMLLLVIAVTGPATRWIGQQLHSSATDRAVLAAAGFRDLTLTESPNGPMIHGIVRDDAELARLRLLVSERIGPAIVDVDTMQALAASATDLLRAQGVDGEAKPRGGHSLLVTAEFLPADRRAELEKLIKRDVPGVTQVAFAPDGGRGDRDLQYFFSGSEYGLATFVDGNPGYITTMDGTRWFAGALVPTGHKIITIGNGRVSFERDGQVEELILGPETPPARPETNLTGVRSNEGAQS